MSSSRGLSRRVVEPPKRKTGKERRVERLAIRSAVQAESVRRVLTNRPCAAVPGTGHRAEDPGVLHEGLWRRSRATTEIVQPVDTSYTDSSRSSRRAGRTARRACHAEPVGGEDVERTKRAKVAVNSDAARPEGRPIRTRGSTVDGHPLTPVPHRPGMKPGRGRVDVRRSRGERTAQVTQHDSAPAFRRIDARARPSTR